MLSRVNASLIVEKLIALSEEFNFPKDKNIGVLRLKTTKVVLEVVEDDLVVSELAEKLVKIWFPFISSSFQTYPQWIEINVKVCGIILESGYYEDDIWSSSDAEDS